MELKSFRCNDDKGKNIRYGTYQRGDLKLRYKISQLFNFIMQLSFCGVLESEENKN